MNMIDNLPGHLLMEALGWALVHFIWQGALIALLLATIMSFIPQRAAEARYLVACAAMLLMLASPIVSTAVIAASTPGSHAPDSNAPGAPKGWVTGDGMTALPDAAPSGPSSSLWRERLTEWMAYGLPWLISIWLAGVLLLSVRLLTGYASAQRLKVRETRPVAERWEETLQSLRGRLGVARPVRLLESALVRVPTAVGWLRPVILLPACALVGLTPRQLEAIIAHELAHIRRHDYLANILQRVIETLLFYHPAVWWVSRQVRIEREYCCDDLAVAACGDALLYARALAEMEEMRAAEPQLAVAANGGPLLDRIRRLAGIPEPHSNGHAGLLAGLIALLIMVALIAGSRGLASTLPAGQVQKQIAFEKITGTWEAKSDIAPDLTAGEVIVKADGNELSGTSIIYLIDDVGTGPRVVKKITLQHIAPRFDGKTLFLKSVTPNGDTLEAELKLTGDDEAEMRVVGEDVPEEIKANIIKLRRVKTRVGDGSNDSQPEDSKQARDSTTKPSPSPTGDQYVESLLAALKDEDFQVRDDAITELGKLGDRRAVEPLIALLKDPNVYIRDNAINALGLIGDRSAVEPLLESLRDPNVYIRDTAITALGRLRDPRAVEPLIALLGDRNVYLRDNAADALGKIGDRRALEPLRAASSDENWYVRQTAVKSLARLSGN
jgi:beta-lactamase regulating signal transducer with metallopeptidase domain